METNYTFEFEFSAAWLLIIPVAAAIIAFFLI